LTALPKCWCRCSSSASDFDTSARHVAPRAGGCEGGKVAPNGASASVQSFYLITLLAAEVAVSVK
jgi:hypothetical protein